MAILNILKNGRIAGKELEILAKAFNVNLEEDFNKEGFTVSNKYGKLKYSKEENELVVNAIFSASVCRLDTDLMKYQGSSADLGIFEESSNHSIYSVKKIKKQSRIPYSDLSKYLVEDKE